MSAPHPTIELWAMRPLALLLEPLPADVPEAILDPMRRMQRARSRTALRLVLTRRLGIPPANISLRVQPGGKPAVSGCEFSISHSGEWLVIAIADSPVGVDIETHTPRREPLELAERFFHAADTEALRSGGADFLRLWVAKEAALKAAGTGIAGHLQKARCVLCGGAVQSVVCETERYAIREFSLCDGTPGALALKSAGELEIVWREAAEAGIS